MELRARSTDVKVVQFATTEKAAIEWGQNWSWSSTASTEHNTRTLLSKLQGPFKLVPFRFESDGSKMRGICADIHLSGEYRTWRQSLVDSILLYRKHFPAWNAGGGQVVLVNFHALDPKKFPDEQLDRLVGRAPHVLALGVVRA